MSRLNAILSLLLLATFSGGCSTSSSATQSADISEPPSIQWPALPRPPRIAYIGTITSPESASIKVSWLQRAWRGLTGKKNPQIRTPQALSIDREGRIYVIDSATRRVHVYDSKSSAYYLFPKKSIPEFNYPVDITSDNRGKVYVSDAISHRVHIFTDHGKNYQGSFGDTSLTRPTGLLLREKENQLLVVDTQKSNIAVFDLDTHELIRTIGSNGSEANSLHYPTAIAASPDDGILVTDSLNFRIQVLSSTFQFVRAFGSAGNAPGYFSRPKGLATDSDGHVYVVDALLDNVQIFNPEGALLLSFGRAGHKAGEFWLPYDIFIDSNDRIYVTDSYNSRIQVFQYFSRIQP